jgi:hypothetical protein
MIAGQKGLEAGQEDRRAEMETIRENMEERLEEMKVQVGSFTSWIDVNHKDLKIMLETLSRKE